MRLSICEFPHTVLKQPTKRIAKVDARIQRLAEAMLKTMASFPHCVGLAAPQVGHSLRLAVMDPSRHPKVKRSCGELVLINPEITAYADWKTKREGCLSVPDFTANVNRAMRVRLEALDIHGQPYALWLEKFDAQVAQHEVDHLDGKLFLDRVSNLRTDIFRRKTYQ